MHGISDRLDKGSLIHRMRLLFILLACSLLSSCYIMPGQFSAHLHIGSDGSFTYRYVGEISYLGIPEELGQGQWDDRAAFCEEEDTAEPRPCRPEEITAQRTAYENARQREFEVAAKLARLTGINVLNDEANGRIAAQLLEHKGWKRAEYKGKAVFEVEYEMTDSLARDFAFPSLPSAQLLIPFLTAQPAKDGRVRVEAAGLTSGLMGRLVKGNDPSRAAEWAAMFAGVNGTLRITTDAKVEITNGSQSSQGGLTQLDWTIRSGAVANMVGDTPLVELRLR